MHCVIDVKYVITANKAISSPEYATI